jgi:long-chain acyl-CoA synthetase
MSDSPWLLHYPEGVPSQLPVRAETLPTMFRRSVEKFPRHTALYFFGKTLSYQECNSLVERFACGLAALGIRKGDRVALCLPNSPQAVIAYFGILRAGGIVVACNPTYTAHELSNQLRDAGSRAIVVLDMMHAKIQPLDLALTVITRITDFMTLTARLFYRQRTRKPAVVIPHSNTTLFFHDLLDMDTPVSPDQLPVVTADDVALLQYTGGTTGVSKGAELRHRNLTANIQQLVSWFAPSEGTERFLAALPLFHVFGMTVTQNICLAVGGCMVLVPDPRDIEGLLAQIRKNKPTVITLVPALVRKLVETCKPQDFEAARFCITGASALPYGLLKQFKERTGHLLVEGYGLSEASPVTHCNIPHGLSVKRSVGLPILNTEARVVDDAGHDIPVGGVGELWVRGPQVMERYWNNPDETANAIKPGGWLATGDMVRMDEDGFFYIVDRKKDMILSSSGFNVYPSEIEQVLLLHPQVRDAAVIGVPRGEGSELIKAFVVSPEGATSADELVAHCRRYLASYKVPKKIEFRAELPRTTHGKILYRVLRKEEEERLRLQHSRAS